MNLGNILLSDTSETQKATQGRIPLTGSAQFRQIHSQKADEWLPGTGTAREWGVTAMGMEFLGRLKK